MLLSVRDRHMSGKMVVRVGRLLARRIELSSRTPLHSLSMRKPQWWAIGILCCVPLVMVIGCPAVCIPPRALRGCGLDLSRALCPKRAPVLGSAALVLRRSTVLSDAECLLGVGSRIRPSLLSILSLDTHDARAPCWPRPRFVGG